MRRIGIKGLTLVFLLVLLVSPWTQLDAFAQEIAKPNVVFILADDLGWVQTSAYGSSYYYTPNIERLAKEGMKFTDAYAAAAVCSPTRASLMTGKSPARLHLTDFIPGANNRNTPLTQPDWQKFLPLNEITLGEIFREKGYRTALFGKWHLSPEKFGPKSLPFYPDKQGFDDYFVIDKPNPNDNPESDPHKSDSIGNASVRFLHDNAKRPFFLFVSFSAVHNPLMDSAAAIQRWKKVKGSQEPENNPVLAAMLSRMDRNIGYILDALDELGLAQNTIVVFYSDNGGLGSDARQTPLKKGKGWLYEGGVRVPLIIRWSGKIRERSVSHEMVSSYDFLPTFCDLLKVKHPANLDGISLLPLLEKDKSLPKRNLYWHYPHYHVNTGMVPGGAIRSGKWKLIEWYGKKGDKSEFELYNLEDDLSEATNVADSFKKKTNKLSKALRKWRQEVNAQMPVVNESYSPLR